MDTIYLIVDITGITAVDYHEFREVVGAYSSRERAEKALEKYEQSAHYRDIDRRTDWHEAEIFPMAVNDNSWIYGHGSF